MMSSLANKLTFSRIIVIPAILVLLVIDAPWAAWTALVLFVAAGVTDWLDGYVARRDAQVSNFGAFLDPIADKLLVASVLLFLVNSGQIHGLSVWPAAIITMREVAVSGLREFLAQVRVSLPVSKLAKWKTTIQIVALSFLIVGKYGPDFLNATLIGDACLWVAGGLTVITGWDYWRASQKHFPN